MRHFLSNLIHAFSQKDSKDLGKIRLCGFRQVALAKEIVSQENPGGLEKRVALIPDDVGKLIQAGVRVYVEHGAGEGMGFSDEEYHRNGAVLQTAEEIYREKDLIIKFKGPSLNSIPQVRAGCTLFCMAHFHSYPDRAKMMCEQRINVIAMEEILESPKVQTDTRILGRTAMAAALHAFLSNNTIGSLRIRNIQWTERLTGAINRAGNRDPRSLHILQPDVNFKDLDATGPDSLYFYDSMSFNDPNGILDKLRASGSHLFDLNEFEGNHGEQAIAAYRESHPPFTFGLRRIQCLHETGMAGARYGLKLLRQNKPELDVRDARVVVLGYGNVGQGAIHELYDQGVHCIQVLGRTHTVKGRIEYWIKDADLIVNGAEQPPHLRGINFLVTNHHLKNVIPDGSVVIDLIGGSETNRSPVEAVLHCTFLNDPYFVQDGVTISALWGWPMMGMMQESCLRYSGQILDVLTGRERLLDGIGSLAPGVRRALVCGPF